MNLKTKIGLLATAYIIIIIITPISKPKVWTSGLVGRGKVTPLNEERGTEGANVVAYRP